MPGAFCEWLIPCGGGSGGADTRRQGGNCGGRSSPPCQQSGCAAADTSTNGWIRHRNRLACMAKQHGQYNSLFNKDFVRSSVGGQEWPPCFLGRRQKYVGHSCPTKFFSWRPGMAARSLSDLQMPISRRNRRGGACPRKEFCNHLIWSDGTACATTGWRTSFGIRFRIS